MPDYPIECQLQIVGDVHYNEVVTLYFGPVSLPFVPSVGMALKLPSATALEGALDVICRSVTYWHEDGAFIVRDVWEVGEEFADMVDFALSEGWREDPPP
jgi:hypothetical protein